MGYVKGETVLPESVGWGIVIGFGLFFSLVTTILSKLEERLMRGEMTSEYFNTAGRTVKTGMTASVLVSQWTWAATLLQSSNVAWAYGVSGPFWYASGASIQVVLFGILAIEVKRKAPNMHTFLELVDVRYGTGAHIVFFVFAIMTNMVVSAMLILGGSATVTMLTGMSTEAAAFLIPIGTITYTLIGGLKATFLASYIHTTYIFVTLLVLAFTVYTGKEIINPTTGIVSTGSAPSVFEGLQAAANASWNANKTGPMEYGPVDGNAGGSFLTMDSREGLMFGIINIVGNFGTVFVDQSYWQSAIAAKPSSAVSGFFLGGLCWFAVPFTMATTMGLAARSLGTQLSAADAGMGLVPPAVAVDLLGQGGAVAVLIMLFMAVTSTGSAELIAVSSLGTYDLYRKYINPEATGEQLLRVSKYFIVGFGLVMGVLAIILQAFNIGLGWVYLFMGILIGSAVVPVALTITWSWTTRFGACAGAIIGLCCSIPSWIIAAHRESGEINVDTLGKNIPMLTGNLFAICVSGFVCVTASVVQHFMGEAPYDWESMQNIRLVDDKQPDLDPAETDPALLTKAKKVSIIAGSIMFLVLIIVWPIPMHASGYVFTESFFTFWVCVAVIWGFIAALIIIILPVQESFADIVALFASFAAKDQSVEVEQPVKKVSAEVPTAPTTVVKEASPELPREAYADKLTAP